MKVALIVPGFSSEEGDWCIPVLVDVVRELSQRVELHIFALRYPFRAGRYRAYGAEVHTLGGADARRFKRLWLGIRAMLAIVVEHRRAPFTVIHGLWADEPGALAAVAGRLLRCPSVVSIMGGELVGLQDIAYGGQLNRSNRLLTRIALRLAGLVTAASARDANHAQVERSSGFRRGVERLVWGVDRSLFECAALDAERDQELFRLVHVGSLLPVKDQRTLLEAFRQLRQVEPRARLDIAGDGICRAELESWASHHGLASAVRFLGPVPRENLAELYRQSDLLIVTSRHEQQPVVVLEAALCGCPALGTSVGILPDLAAHGARVLSPGNVAGLVSSLLDLRQSSDLRCRGHRLKKVVLDSYLASHTAERLVSFYAEAAVS